MIFSNINESHNTGISIVHMTALKIKHYIEKYTNKVKGVKYLVSGYASNHFMWICLWFYRNLKV